MTTIAHCPAGSGHPQTPVGRRRWEHGALLAGVGLLIVWLLAHRGEVATGLTAIAGATPAWLLTAVLAAVTVQIAAAGALHAVSPRQLGIGGTLRIQLAGAAAAAATPGGIGGAALHALELERAGSSRSGSWSAVIAVRTTTSLLHVLALVAALPVVHRTLVPELHVPTWSLLLLLAVGVTVLGCAATSPALRGRAAACWSQRRPTALLRRRAVTLCTGAGGTTLARGLPLWACLQAVGGDVPLTAVISLFLVADAAGALSGAPNGLGAFDLLVLTGLEAAGVGAPVALAALVLHRLLTVWLPIVPGLVALTALRPTRSVVA